MEWSEQERALAKELHRKDMREFLEKIFCKLETQNGELVKAKIVELDDARYGQLMKVLWLTKKENKAKLQLISQIATGAKKEGKSASVAPR